MQQFFGKYRGKVTVDRDPLNLGRVQVNVASVFEEGKQSWAMPCTPYAGKGIGLFTIPPVGSNVWVEFEGGDPDYPIWSGCFWGNGELPDEAKAQSREETIVFKAFASGGKGITITMSAKGMTIEADPLGAKQPLKLVFNSSGIEISAGAFGTIKAAPTSVKINDTALEVT
ncbi:phage baseplate assembly protein V [Leptolyngbya sp. FACHB-17]|uniref:phage baseplate assembly protein V n=1 Tax=unclassified Leptolyngbya TaxID=2650499 RepID=UPI0016806FC9|nr:phage baseplate assembly protein V [Leptolyngbya sp. FACHB-17]MBD2080948.1 baseplate assembly protein [Leptolyngbya sp. FACHB-17]